MACVLAGRVHRCRPFYLVMVEKLLRSVGEQTSDAESDCGEAGSYDSDEEPEWIRYTPRGLCLWVQNKLGDACTRSTAYQIPPAPDGVQRS